MSVKAIVFDYGQVISLPQDPAVPGELARMIGTDREKFEPLLWTLRSEYDRGVITAREYYRNILSRLDISMNDADIDKLIAVDLTSWQNINTETVALMEDVKKAGYTLGILSNMPHDFLAWARKNVPAFSLPHISLFSCELNLVKPEVAIFRETISRFGVKSGELVFFDDNAENVKSARAQGIEAFIWKGAENARRELESLGVRL